MGLAEQARNIDAADLRNYVEAFCRQNANSRDVEHRWLAAYAQDLLLQAYNVKTGNHNTIREQVEKFRLGEIAEARKKLAEQDAVLEKEARQFTVDKKEAFA